MATFSQDITFEDNKVAKVKSIKFAPVYTHFDKIEFRYLNHAMLCYNFNPLQLLGMEEQNRL